MQVINIADKTYTGEIIYEKKTEGYEYEIYCINNISDKYLILNKSENAIKEYTITGIHQVYDIMETLKNVSPTKLKKDMLSMIQEFRTRSTNRMFKRVDTQKLRQLIYEYYDNNYTKFIVIGLKLNELVEKECQKA